MTIIDNCKGYFTNFKLYLYILALLVFTSIDYILYVNWIDTMKNYNWYAGSFIFPLIGCLFFWIPTWYYIYIKKEDFHHEKNIQQKNLFKIGVLDSLNSIGGTFATPFLSIVIMTITDKLTLPLMMLASYFILKRRYLKSHYLGCLLTIYGIMVAFVPDFQSDKTNNYLWLTIYTLALIPAVASFCIKEVYLKNKSHEYNIYWLNAWISVWQLLFGFITFPILFIPLPPPAGNNIQPSEVPEYFLNATKCQFGGVNSLDNDNCRYSFVLLFLYQCINTLINILMFLIIREGSSVNFIIVNALKSPVTAYLGSIKLLAGDHQKSITSADLFSFIILFIAAIVYNDQEEIEEKIDTQLEYYEELDEGQNNSSTISIL